MNRLIIFMVITLAGCAQFDEPTYADVTRPVNEIAVYENPKLASEGVANILPDGKCVIVLKRYPRCLKHEVRHCLEGFWHGKKPNDEDCY